MFNLFFLLFIQTAVASPQIEFAGYNLTEIGTFLYDANPPGQPPTPAQKVIDRLATLGIKHIELNPRAVMRDPKGAEITPITSPSDRSAERQRYLRLMNYIKGRGMTVGIRPIFFVVDAQGNPLYETLPNGSKRVWWHGNIRPKDPDKWFEAFKVYLDIYLLAAKLGKADTFTLGAELYSMTVGIEDQWKENPYGFPGRWLELLSYIRSKLPRSTKIMYDVNFTDDTTDAGGGVQTTGGELERWRYRLVDLANPSNPEERKIWVDLVKFWNNIDAIGVDMYRSLYSKNLIIPDSYPELVKALTASSEQYASQLDTVLAEIQSVTGDNSPPEARPQFFQRLLSFFTEDGPKPIVFKEVGYKSVKGGFIDPFEYDDPNNPTPLNIDHQAAAFEAFFNAFWLPGWSWMRGTVFWDVSVDLSRHGPTDRGFSPLGKTKTEEVLRRFFKAGAGNTGSRASRRRAK